MADQPLRFSLQKLLAVTALIAVLVFALSRAYFLDVANDEWDGAWQVLDGSQAFYLQACEASRKLREAEVGAMYSRPIANRDHICRIEYILSNWKDNRGIWGREMPARLRAEWDAIELYKLEAIGLRGNPEK